MKHWIIGLLLLPIGALAQVKFTTIVSDKKVGKKDYFTVQYVVEGGSDVRSIDVGSFGGVRVVGGPNSSSSMEIINGQQKTKRGIEYLLQPTRTGVIKIPSAYVMVDGNNYESKSVDVVVSTEDFVVDPDKNANNNNMAANPFAAWDDDPFAALQEQRQQQKPDLDYYLMPKDSPIAKIGKNLFIRVETDKQTVFEGEPVIATYKLYSRLNVNSRVTKQPSFSGATAVDLMDANAPAQTVESYGGKKYAVYLIRKLALYPLHAGDLVLEAAETENEIHFTRVRDMAEAQAGGGRDEQYMHVLKSKPVTLKVKALPEAKKPAGFGGAVGSGYSIEAVTNTNNIPAGEIMKLMVLVKGSGNMQMLTAPMVPWGEDAESFETKSKEDMDVSTVPLTGRKAFEYSFSINKEGSYTIPPIKLDYFDTKSNSYKSIASQPIVINVSKGTGKKPVRPNAGEANKNETASANWLWWVVGGVVLLLTGLLWIFASRRNKRQAVEDTPTLASLTTATVPETANAETATYEEKVPYEKPDPLKQSRDLLYSQNSKAFYQQLQKDLWPVLQTKFGLPPHDTNKQNLAFAMQNAATNQAMQANILQLLSNMETALYAPFSSADSLFNDFMQAEGIVKNL